MWLWWLSLALFSSPSLGQPWPEECVCFEKLTSEAIRSPVEFTVANDGTNRLFVAEQAGVVWIYDTDGNRVEEPFLDLEEDVNICRGVGYTECGFYAVEFHPNFELNRKLYAYYSVSSDGNHESQLVELRVSEDDPNRVDPDTERVLLTIDQPFNNHNGGDILFGADDGYLYLFIGDGGFANDPTHNALDLSNFLGKTLRIDVDNPSGELEYGIPQDNPFVGVEGARDEIFVYGLRNPWRATKDRGHPDTGAGHGDIYIGDVGQNAVEEVDILRPEDSGRHYGWSCYEGTRWNTEASDPKCNDFDMESNIWPIFDYTHSLNPENEACIIGGYRYRGCTHQRWANSYLFADWRFTNPSRTFRMEQEGEEWEAIEQVSGGDCTPCSQLNEDWVDHDFVYLSSYGEDENGEIYVLTTDNYGPNQPEGAVYKLIDPASHEPCE